MKRKFLFSLAVAAIAVGAAWHVNFSSQTNGVSDIFLANVEALADPEAYVDMLCIQADDWCHYPAIDVDDFDYYEFPFKQIYP